MEQENIKYRRTKNHEVEETKEAKKIVDRVTKEIFKNYKDTPHSSISMKHAMEDMSDMNTIHDCIHRIILRRNATYLLQQE